MAKIKLLTDELQKSLEAMLKKVSVEYFEFPDEHCYYISYEDVDALTIEQKRKIDSDELKQMFIRSPFCLFTTKREPIQSRAQAIYPGRAPSGRWLFVNGVLVASGEETAWESGAINGVNGLKAIHFAAHASYLRGKNTMRPKARTYAAREEESLVPNKELQDSATGFVLDYIKTRIGKNK